MTITLKIDNPDIEKELTLFIKEQKEVTLEVLSSFINTFQKKKPIAFQKKDPNKYRRVIKYLEDDNENLDDVKPYSHIKDSAKYIHDLRRQRV